MTYCVGIRLNAGLVFLSDSRTNAGMDQISTFRKMIFFEMPGERVIVLLSAGNLAVSQSVTGILRERVTQAKNSLLTARSMADAASGDWLSFARTTTDQWVVAKAPTGWPEGASEFPGDGISRGYR